jgi:flagellar biosynthesis regulator FlbT
MRDDSRLLVIERVLPKRIDPDDVLTPGRFIHDINMMLNPGGRERTETEFRDLLARAGLRLARVVPTPCPLAVIEADPA